MEKEVFDKKYKKSIELGMTPPTSAMSTGCWRIWEKIVENIKI